MQKQSPDSVAPAVSRSAAERAPTQRAARPNRIGPLDVHLAPGQGKHLPHEAWHIVQQAQGRVRPTMPLQRAAINDDPALEREATTMGARASGAPLAQRVAAPIPPAANGVAQLTKAERLARRAAAAAAAASTSSQSASDHDDDHAAGGGAAVQPPSNLGRLAHELGYEPDELRELATFAQRGDPLQGIESYDATDFDDRPDGRKSELVEQFGRDFAGYARVADRIAATAPSGGRSRGDWATGAVRGAAREIAAQGGAHFPGDSYTIHHKVSRDKLRRLHTRMEAAGAAAEPVRAVLAGIGPSVGSDSPLRILLNMPANLEVGPPADRREGDPGTGFDPNLHVDGSGVLSPRSAPLHRVDQMIEAPQIAWEELAVHLNEAHMRHRRATGDAVLTPPRLDQWRPVAGNKFVRMNE